MTAPGFDVDIAALRMYAEDLNNYAAQTATFGNLVGQADVSHESWGIVGLFTKERYGRLLGQLAEFLQQAEKYLDGMDQRVVAAADGYDQFDAAAKAELDKLNKELGESSRQARVSNSTSGVHIGAHGHGWFKVPHKVPGPGEGIHAAKETVAAFKGVSGSDDEVPAILAASAFTVAEGASFAYECVHAVGVLAKNPLKFLVECGLDFLLEIFTPLQDAIHYVSGDAHALEQAAEQFREIGEGLDGMSDNFVTVADQRLAGWRGTAASAAKTRLAEFSNGIDGLAARSGSLAEILYMSSIVMDIIEDLIKSIVSEFVMWLLALWIPALAAAVFTFGGSTAAAAAGTAVKATHTVAETTSWIAKIVELLGEIKDILIKLGFNLLKGALKALNENVSGYHSRAGKKMNNEQLTKAFATDTGPLDPDPAVSGQR